ncbi:MAG: respiratory nitrate reductase subunit gamma [Polyangiaceae bacterium]|nr:respiratory nitrate reductase subunit gamma [Polyangiaceae bacterium]MCE7889151.1 respiratory nitrate reductase subunit gamma [Sorangiineae bacterium PRO1]MCL4755615.1 respiratory nitrate reductase subunit gamma [Myxococcales bacterium]
MTLPNLFFFVGLPYIAIVTFLVGTIQRYRNTGFKVSSLSSQFLEGKRLFWASVPFHFGILVVFFGHLTAFLIPAGILAWNSNPVRLLVLQITAWAFGLSVLVGLVGLMLRRLTNARVKMVTTRMDLLIELMLLVQTGLGLYIGYAHRWGASWFAADLSPYLWSLFLLDPQITAVSAMPLVIKLHIITAFLIIGIFPFTRLVHVLVAPLHYLNRPYQRVIWNYDRRAIRDPKTPWSPVRPKNN